MKLRWIWVCVAVMLVVGCGSDNSTGDRWDVGENQQTDAGQDVGSDVGGDGGPGCLAHVPAQHRAAAAACDHVRPDTEPDPGPSYGGPMDCTQNSDCTDGDNGRCVGNGHDGWHCTYDECFADSDCPTSSVCACEGGFRSDANVCLAGNCRTDADCGDSGYCSPSFGSCGSYSGVVGYFCHTCDDECVDDADCGGGGAYCMFDQSVSHWICSTMMCAG